MPANDEGSYRVEVDSLLEDGIGENDGDLKSGTINDYFDVIKVIGKGAFATVYHGKERKRGGEVAIKEIDIEGASEDERAAVDAEIAAIKSLRHRHIITYIESYKFDRKVYIILEYASLGSIRQLYLAKGKLRESESLRYAKQIAAGLQHLHSLGIAHRDIKCANCLLTEDGAVKLSDFGSSKQISSDSVRRGLKGTPHWMAPEVIKGLQMRDGWLSADIWSFGCTLVEMITAKLPYAEYEMFSAMYRIASGETPRIGDLNVSDSLGRLLVRCCSVLPSERPSCTEILGSPAMGGDIDKERDGKEKKAISDMTISEGEINQDDILNIFSTLEISNSGAKAMRRVPTVVRMGTGSMTTALRLKQSAGALETSKEIVPLNKTSLDPIKLSPRSSHSPPPPALQPRRVLLGALTNSSTVRGSLPRPSKRVHSASTSKYPLVLPPLAAKNSRKIKSAPATSQSLHFINGLDK